MFRIADPVDEPRRPRGPRRVPLVDVAMLVLAVVSVVLLVWVAFFPHSEEFALRVFVIDTVICGIFLVEFLFRWRDAGWERWFPVRRWYEVLGMIPVAHPALRGLRLIRIVVIVVRLARTADRVFGELATQRLVERLSRPIVMAIKTPITVAVLDEVVKVIGTGHFPRNIANSLGQNQDLLRGIVTEKMKQDRHAGRLAILPFHDEIVHGVVDMSMRVIVDVLTDPRMDAFVAGVVQENALQIREAVVAGHHELEDATTPPRAPRVASGA
jgi:voltage-gated potassium channel